jgi:Domain of unknown function (DUF4411)
VVAPRYCIDTSSLILLADQYPQVVFESLWSWIEEMIDCRRLFAPDEVLAELEGKGTDILSRWARTRKDRFFRPADADLQVRASEILSRFPNLTKKNKPFAKSEGDAWVIALALQEKSLCVSNDKNPKGGVSFPSVCQAYGVECLNFVEFLKRERAKF